MLGTSTILFNGTYTVRSFREAYQYASMGRAFRRFVKRRSGGIASNRLEADETNCDSTEGNSAIIDIPGGFRRTITRLAKQGVPSKDPRGISVSAAQPLKVVDRRRQNKMEIVVSFGDALESERSP